jgi:glycosyltransferase involved in cell wall biosynthesis
MNKLKCVFLLDPLQTQVRSSHNFDVQTFIENLLDEQSIRFEKGFVLKESRFQNKWVYKTETLFKLAVAALFNAIKATRLAHRYDVTVFNPNDDPISLYLLQEFRNCTSSEFTIKSRFICTRDRILIRQDSFLISKLKKRISTLIRPEDKISAETLSYSDFLSMEFNIMVDFVPYPPIDYRFSEVSNRIENILFVALGAAREDKGFDTLITWIDRITQNNPDARFVIQEASKKWKGYEENLQKLKDLDNVRMLPSFIEPDTQRELLSSSFAVLAPYDPKMYQFRGSAFVRRAMYMGKLICTSPDTSLSRDAENHNLLLFPESSINEQRSSQSHKVRHELGIELQRESIQAWKSFLL